MQTTRNRTMEHAMQDGDDDEDVETNNLNLLSEVTCPEDKSLILDVLHAIRICRKPESLCTTWTVTPVSTGYILVAYLPKPTGSKAGMCAPVEITHDDINLIESVNNLRVRVGVAMFPSGLSSSSASAASNPTSQKNVEGLVFGGANWGLKISITSHLVPVTFSRYDTIRFSNKRMMMMTTACSNKERRNIFSSQSSRSASGGDHSASGSNKRLREKD